MQRLHQRLQDSNLDNIDNSLDSKISILISHSILVQDL